MRAARLARSTDVVSYEVRKSAIDVIAENAWWLAALLVLVGCLYTVAEESRTRWVSGCACRSLFQHVPQSAHLFLCERRGP